MRLSFVVTAVLGLLASDALAQGKPKPAPQSIPLQTEDEKTFYALGHTLGKGLQIFSVSPAELEIVKRGIMDAVNESPPAVDVDHYASRVQALARKRETQASEALLARAAQEKGAVKLPSGVVYQELKAGSGASPGAKDTVSVHYRGTLMNGEEFDSSFRRNQPAEFPLNGVISCWTQGLQQMKVGGKAKLTCPANTAYGERPPMGSKIPPNAVLVFEVELLGIPGNTFGR